MSISVSYEDQEDGRIPQSAYADGSQAASPSRPIQSAAERVAHLTREERLRLCVWQVLHNASPVSQKQLQGLSQLQWRSLIQWLDSSGLALYFYNRLAQLGRLEILPPAVEARLRQNLADNTVRMRSLVSESIAIQQEFQAHKVKYALLKGQSLLPHSVPSLELRSQLDLDFLVAESSMPVAQDVLERRGYRLYAIGGRSWEFKRNEKPGMSIRDLYKDRQSCAVELHNVPAGDKTGLLDRIGWQEISGIRMPLLSAVDLFLGQGLHVFKHACSAFMRAAHLWEYRTHILFRCSDEAFWTRVEDAASRIDTASVRLGVATLLATELTGDFAPEGLTNWTCRTVPIQAHTWIKMYGCKSMLGNFPGNKRYLLLLRALHEGGIRPETQPPQSIIPRCLPTPVVRARPGETILERASRNWTQIKYLAHRLRFHAIAGFDFYRESIRWNGMMGKLKAGR